MIVCIFIKGGLSVNYVVIFAYGSELFPSNIRGTANGIVFFGAKMMGMLSPYLINLSRDVFNVNAMVGCGVTSVIAMLGLLLLPETFKQKVE